MRRIVGRPDAAAKSTAFPVRRAGARGRRL